jgi:hypothetical protein
MFTRKKEKKEYNANANIFSLHCACVVELSRLYNGKYPQLNFWSFVQLKTPGNEQMHFADISGCITTENEHGGLKANTTIFDRDTHVIHSQWQWDRAFN